MNIEKKKNKAQTKKYMKIFPKKKRFQQSQSLATRPKRGIPVFASFFAVFTLDCFLVAFAKILIVSFSFASIFTQMKKIQIFFSTKKN